MTRILAQHYNEFGIRQISFACFPIRCGVAEARDELQEVDPFQEISFRGEGPRTLKMGARHCYHTACPVPVDITKAIEIEAGLALPVDAVKVVGRGQMTG